MKKINASYDKKERREIKKKRRDITGRKKTSEVIRIGKWKKETVSMGISCASFFLVAPRGNDLSAELYNRFEEASRVKEKKK